MNSVCEWPIVRLGIYIDFVFTAALLRRHSSLQNPRYVCTVAGIRFTNFDLSRPFLLFASRRRRLMGSLLRRRCCLMLSRSRRVRRRRRLCGSMVHRRSLMRRWIAWLSGLLLRLRTRGRSRMFLRRSLARLRSWGRSVVCLRSWLRDGPVVVGAIGLRRRSLLHLRRGRRLVRIVGRRMRHVLRRPGPLIILRLRHLVVLRGMRYVRLLIVHRRTWSRLHAIVTRCRIGRGVVRHRQSASLCSRGVKGTRLRGGDYRRASLICRCELGRIGTGRVGVLDLCLGWGEVLLLCSRRLLRRRLRLDSARASVVSHPVDVHIVDYGLVVHIGHVRDIYVVNRPVVIEVAAVPVSAIVAITGVAEAVVNTSVETDRRTPVTDMPKVESL